MRLQQFTLSWVDLVSAALLSAISLVIICNNSLWGSLSGSYFEPYETNMQSLDLVPDLPTKNCSLGFDIDGYQQQSWNDIDSLDGRELGGECFYTHMFVYIFMYLGSILNNRKYPISVFWLWFSLEAFKNLPTFFCVLF